MSIDKQTFTSLHVLKNSHCLRTQQVQQLQPALIMSMDVLPQNLEPKKENIIHIIHISKIILFKVFVGIPFQTGSTWGHDQNLQIGLHIDQHQ